MAVDDCARARALKKTCVLTIGPEQIEGGVPGGEGFVVDVWTPSKHTSLIRIRRDYIPEILKSANDVE